MIIESEKKEKSNEINFKSLNINENVKKCLSDMKMKIMTPIQAKCIPELLKGIDLMGAAKTGSGKTLAFLVPLVHKLMENDLPSNCGTAAIILSPTRELSQQIFDVLNHLIVGTNIKTELITGGNNRIVEARSLRNGVTVIVATPGRLKDHLNNTDHFLTHRLHTLIIDEADRLMEHGFYEDMQNILSKLPKLRQTILFSATLNITFEKLKSNIKNNKNVIINNNKKSSVEDKVLSLASLSLKKNCVYVDISTEDLPGNNQSTNDNEWTSTVSQLQQSYIIPKDEDKFLWLYSFIQKWKNLKVMIFMSTNVEVKYYSSLFTCVNVPVLAFYGKLKQSERDFNFGKFKDNESVVILCTDVAARGLDVPNVDMVIQYDPPRDYKEYLHRVGRTARAGHTGQAIIFLRNNEIGFLSILKKKKIPLQEMELVESKKPPIQDKLEEYVQSNGNLKICADSAFVSLTRAYKTYSKTCFDVNQLDLYALAKTFGLKEAPQALTMSSMKRKKRPLPTNQNHYMPMKKLKE